MNRLSRLSLASLRVAKVFFGLTLVASTLWSTVPSAASDIEPTCHLACCAGMATHRAGSCMNGSCHAFGGVIHRPSQRQHSQPPELLCGVEQLTRSASWLLVAKASNVVRDLLVAGPEVEHLGILTTPAVTKPCQPECGNAGFTNLRDQGNHASGAVSRNAPAESSFVGYYDYSQPKRVLSANRRKGSPRGPPHSLS